MINLDDVKSNNKLKCIRCGDPITVDNWTGWESFLPDGKTTQHICKFCCLIDNTIQEKSE
jgi:hypothetical protein